MLTAKTQRTQSKLFFPFAAETQANENYNAFGNLKLLKYYPPGLEFILFRPLSEKRIRKNSLRTLRLERSGRWTTPLTNFILQGFFKGAECEISIAVRM